MGTRAMPEDFVEALASFTADLKYTRREAGDIPYRKLARISGYSPSTITRLLAGHSLPAWDLVRTFLRACEVEPKTITDTWRPRWVKLANWVDPIAGGETDIGEQSLPTAVMTGQVCRLCGAWIIDVDLHDEFHAQFVPRPRRPDVTQQIAGLSIRGRR